jgi:FdhD protein
VENKMNDNATIIREYVNFDSGKFTSSSSSVIIEAKVDLSINGEYWLSFSCTPLQLEDLGIGFLFNEYLIQKYEEIADIRICPENYHIDAWLNHQVEKPEKWQRSSGCTGGYSPNRLNDKQSAVSDKSSISPDFVLQSMEILYKNQSFYRNSGGVHSTCLLDSQNNIFFSEDIGRHNTIDKIAGIYLKNGMEFKPKLMLTTGRISSDMLLKSARLEVPIVVSRSSPTSLSIDLAEKYGITLIGYSRMNHFNIYTHPDRIKP